MRPRGAPARCERLSRRPIIPGREWNRESDHSRSGNKAARTPLRPQSPRLVTNGQVLDQEGEELKLVCQIGIALRRNFGKSLTQGGQIGNQPFDGTKGHSARLVLNESSDFCSY